MGTRHLTRIYDYDDTLLLTMYGQYDGYPDGYGNELAKFLSEFTLVNGIGDQKFKIANGPGCLAAQIVSHFKGDGVGSFYIYPPDSSPQEFEYRVHCIGSYLGSPKKIELRVTSVHNPKFSWVGDPKNFDGKKIQSKIYEVEHEEDEVENDKTEALLSQMRELVQEWDGNDILDIAKRLAEEKLGK